MDYLYAETFLGLVLVLILGIFIGWLIWGRRVAAWSEVGEERDKLRHSLDSANAQLASCRGQLSAAEEALAAANKLSTEPEPQAQLELTPNDALEEEQPVSDQWRPKSLSEPQGEKDELQRIKGVGPKIESTLNMLGIYHFSQIAAFTDENIAWVNSYLSFKGRIQREKWVAQAKELAAKNN